MPKPDRGHSQLAMTACSDHAPTVAVPTSIPTRGKKIEKSARAKILRIAPLHLSLAVLFSFPLSIHSRTRATTAREAFMSMFRKAQQSVAHQSTLPSGFGLGNRDLK